MLKRKQVLFVIDSLYIGGAEKSLTSLLYQLNPQKYEIHLWIRCRGGELEALLPKDVVVIPSPYYSIMEKVLYRFSLLAFSAAFRILRYAGIKKHSAEILWKCTGWATKVPTDHYDVTIAYQQGLPTYLVTKKIHAKKRIVWDNTYLQSAGYDMSYNGRFYAKADHIVTVSQILYTLMTSCYPQYREKIHCVYDILSPSLIQQQALFENPITETEGIIIVTVGRLEHYKQHTLAVEAARILRDKAFSFRWYIVGEGSERPYLESLINEYGLQEHVILLGKQLNPYPYIYRCDIYVQTSSFEGYGLSIAEAKILERPVVSTNFDAIHDQLRHEKNGLIAEMTAESIANNIIRLIEDELLRQRIINNVKAEKNTTAETEIIKVEKLLDED
ncbi:MAG: glycosyltransferase [Prevotella sp.]|nr:glycosyltransferase [Prevotella sp.]